MKSLQSLFFITVFVFSGITSAQDVDDAQQAQRNGNKGMEKILTPDQLALLQEQNDLVKNQREAFKTARVSTTKSSSSSSSMSEGSSYSGFCARDNEDQQTSITKKEKRRIGKYKKKHLEGAFIFGEKRI